MVGKQGREGHSLGQMKNCSTKQEIGGLGIKNVGLQNREFTVKMAMEVW